MTPAFAPTSGCTPACIDELPAQRRVRLPLRLGRMVALAATVGAGVGVAAARPLLSSHWRDRTLRGWFRSVVRASGVRLVVTGEANLSGTAGAAGATDHRATLVASNHVSWLDVPALLALEPMRVLAKSDVRDWPVIGSMAARGGTLFISRQRLSRLPGTVHEIAGALASGHTVLVFPEGSTYCDRSWGRCHRATIQSAVTAGVPVRPVRLRYRFADGTPTNVAGFLGDDGLLNSVWRVAGARGLLAEITVGSLVTTKNRDRRQVGHDVAAAIRPEPR